MTIAAHHAVPNLQEGRLPTAVEHWPARSTHSPHSAMMQSTDMFLGAGPDMADVVPARGYLNMTALSLETEIANTRRPVIAKPAELVKIEQFIDKEAGVAGRRGICGHLSVLGLSLAGMAPGGEINRGRVFLYVR